MKTATISYEIVCKEIEELVRRGEKITVRNVVSRTGGAVSRVMEFIKRWREESNIGKLNLDLNISDELQRALLVEKSAVIAKTAAAYKIQLSDLEILLQEANEILKTQEQQQLESNSQTEELKQEVAILRSGEMVYQEQIKQLEHKLNSALETNNQVNNNLVKLEIRFENADIIVGELKEKLLQQENDLLQLRQSKHQAETDAAVWQAKHQQLANQMDLLIASVNKK